MTERDTKFLGFARLLYPDISQRFFTMYARIMEQTDINILDALEDGIETLIAQRAYDLAVHVLTEQMTNDHYRYPEDSAREALHNNEISDLTQWPESSTE